ncbi:MAG: GIY-YIG nuclease family protein [Halanaerobiales bacterium]|nr:GIY-YIG nuclease family protein [Halanaerobiales bacterium]
MAKNKKELEVIKDNQSNNSHYIYVVECSDGSLYTGYTTDIERRLEEHNAGVGAKYTRGRIPVKLRHQESFKSRSLAQKREYEIKQLPRRKKEELID